MAHAPDVGDVFLADEVKLFDATGERGPFEKAEPATRGASKKWRAMGPGPCLLSPEQTTASRSDDSTATHPRPVQVEKGSDMAEVRAGQVWSYRTRPGEEHSQLRVLLTETETETDPVLGLVVHVSVHDVVVPNPRSDSGYTTCITHVPLSQEAFERSAVDLLGTDPGEPDLEGYRTWRDDNGGVFTISLAEVVDHVEYALRVVVARQDEP